MSTIETAVLALHIAAGVLALLAGAAALGTKKGGDYHVRAGRAYVLGMAVVVVTVLPLLAMDPTPTRQFLTLVAVFSGYFVATGYRALTQGRGRNPEPAALDWTMATVALVSALALFSWGFWRLREGGEMAIVMLVFGALGAAFATADLKSFRNLTWPGDAVVAHFSRMIGGYIATVTAVVVVNVSTGPPAVRWLAPTVVGVPLIFYWQRRWADTGPLARIWPQS